VVHNGASPYGTEVVSRSPPLRMFAPILVAAAACALPGAQPLGDREHYVAALAPGPAATRLEHCEAIGALPLQGDCITALVTAAAVPADMSAPELCERIHEAAWRDECTFVAAEHALEAEDPGAAAALCLASGRYAKSCAAHLWQTELRTALGDHGVALLVGERPAVDEIHDRWSEHFGPGATFDEIFWQNCYRLVFERAQLLEVSACERVPPMERAPCLRGAVTTYRNWLHHSPLLQEDRDLICAAPLTELTLDEVSALLDIPRSQDHPRIAGVLRGFHTAVCRDGAVMRPASDKLREPRGAGGPGQRPPSGAPRPGQ
jgi:hypothetical protein